jgi:hypothetical protein
MNCHEPLETCFFVFTPASCYFPSTTHDRHKPELDADQSIRDTSKYLEDDVIIAKQLVDYRIAKYRSGEAILASIMVSMGMID